MPILPSSKNAHQLVSGFITINGIYDVFCALSLLKIIPVFDSLTWLQHIHLNMMDNYKHPTNPLFERFFAYWVFTYGVIRLTNHRTKPIVSYSYFIESLWIANETYIHASIPFGNGTYVVVVCLILGYLARLSDEKCSEIYRYFVKS